jgi:hypothetical protein
MYLYNLLYISTPSLFLYIISVHLKQCSSQILHSRTWDSCPNYVQRFMLSEPYLSSLDKNLYLLHFWHRLYLNWQKGACWPFTLYNIEKLKIKWRTRTLSSGNGKDILGILPLLSLTSDDSWSITSSHCLYC